VLPAQCVKKRVLQELAFIAHDILRVQKLLLEPHLTTWGSPDSKSTLKSPTKQHVSPKFSSHLCQRKDFLKFSSQSARVFLSD
jgi:hypothetical protein